jgi:hypothetical protein
VKPKRIVDRELLETVRNLPCMACGIQPAGHAHHVDSRGAGGDDVFDNLMSLCPTHHAQWHQKGPGYMMDHYESVTTWLEIAGRHDVIARAERGRRK